MAPSAPATAFSVLLAILPVALPAQAPLLDQPPGPHQATLGRKYVRGAPGSPQILTICGGSTFAPTWLLLSPSLLCSPPSPMNIPGVSGELVVDPSASVLVPAFATGPGGCVTLSFGVARSSPLLYAQGVMLEPGGVTLTPARPVAHDLVTLFHETVNSYPPGGTVPAFPAWANGYTIVPNVYEYTPGGGGNVIEINAAPGTNAGGFGWQFDGEPGPDMAPHAAGGCILSYWFAVDDVPSSSNHDFAHKLMVTPGLTTTGVRTLFEVKADGSVVIHGFDGPAYDTGMDLTLNQQSAWGGKWYLADIMYLQHAAATANGWGEFRIRIQDQNGPNVVDESTQRITLNSNEASYTHFLWESGRRSAVDEVSFHY